MAAVYKQKRRMSCACCYVWRFRKVNHSDREGVENFERDKNFQTENGAWRDNNNRDRDRVIIAIVSSSSSSRTGMQRVEENKV